MCISFLLILFFVLSWSHSFLIFFLFLFFLSWSCSFCSWSFRSFLLWARRVFRPFQFFGCPASFGCLILMGHTHCLYRVGVVLISRRGGMILFPSFPEVVKLDQFLFVYYDFGPSCKPVLVTRDSPMHLDWGNLGLRSESVDSKAFSMFPSCRIDHVYLFYYHNC